MGHSFVFYKRRLLPDFWKRAMTHGFYIFHAFYPYDANRAPWGVALGTGPFLTGGLDF